MSLTVFLSSVGISSKSPNLKMVLESLDMLLQTVYHSRTLYLNTAGNTLFIYFFASASKNGRCSSKLVNLYRLTQQMVELQSKLRLD